MKTDSVPMATSGGVVTELVEVINANRDYLSEIDGAIGDGDHGVNMSKGFSQCGHALAGKPQPLNLADAFNQLSMTLMEGIGGSMGPLYGSFFLGLAESLEHKDVLDAAGLAHALTVAVDAVKDIGDASVGDKTLMDTLVPARDALNAAVAQGAGFADALDRMVAAAEQGKESTRALQARIGRAARLGERSIGVLDAGATSCFLILQAIARSLQRRLGA